MEAAGEHPGGTGETWAASAGPWRSAWTPFARPCHPGPAPRTCAATPIPMPPTAPIDLDALGAFLLSDQAPEGSMSLSDLDGLLAECDGRHRHRHRHRLALSSTLHVSFDVRSDEPLMPLGPRSRSRLSRCLVAHVESAKTSRGGEAVQDPRAKPLTCRGSLAAAHRTGS